MFCLTNPFNQVYLWIIVMHLQVKILVGSNTMVVDHHFVDGLILQLKCQLAMPEVIPEKSAECVVLLYTCD